MIQFKKGLKRLKEIFYFSDSEPNEVLIAFCHLFALPCSLVIEFHQTNFLFFLIAIFSGMFQLWAVAINGSLKMRLIAVQLASLIAFSTVINLSMANLMKGSRTGWIIILLFAIWNCVRVFKEKLNKE